MADKYVRATGGSDGNTGLSFAQGWATLQYAFDNLSTLDVLHICSDVSNKFTISANVDVDTTTGTITAPIYVKGADLVDGSPYDGAGQAYIVTASTITGMWNIANGYSYYYCCDLNFDGGGSGNGASAILSSGTSSAGWTFLNCRFTNCSSHGINAYVRPGVTGGIWTLTFCEVDNNGKGGTGIGIANSAVSNRCMVNVHHCNIHDNADDGFRLGNASSVVFASIFGTVFFRNGASGLLIAGDSPVLVSSNVFFDNGQDGLEFNASDNMIIHGFVNNIFSENDAYAINTNSQANRFPCSGYNCYYNNTSGNIDTGSIPGHSNITSDPKFVNTGIGTEDFDFQSGSPCLDTGIGYS